LRYVARTLLARPGKAPVPLAASVDPTRQRVAHLTHEPAVVGGPELAIRDAARLMVERGARCVLVRDGDGDGFAGIVTDHDLRARVLAAERSGDAPIAAVMSSPVVTVLPERPAADAMLAMLDRGIRHLPIVTARHEALGVLRDLDLLAVQARTPFAIRSAIAAATDRDAVRRAATGLADAVVTLHDARMNEAQISGVISVVADAAVRRLLDLAAANVPAPAWIALGSHGRREAMPSSDLDSAIAWKPDGADVADAVGAVARSLVDDLAACGFPSDPNGAAATNSLFARSSADWDTWIRGLLADPRDERALILISLACDARVVTGGEWLTDPFAPLGSAPARPLLRRLLLRVGLGPRPPTGFLRDVVVEHSGEHRGRFDIKRGGLLPIANLARYAGVAAGSRVTGTVERLRVAAEAGTLPRETAASLEEAYDLLTALRLDHQVTAIRAGRPADDFIDPRTLSPLARRFLRDAFRAIASIQRTLENEIEFAGPPA
jgi:CBS domain-containing protein